MAVRRDLHEANRASWNAATVAHNSHKADQAGFLRRGGCTLFPEEVELLGAVGGVDLLHLQCNAGQDALSLAARGARVTGVDISDEAIAFAQQLSTDSGVPARFVRADVYDWLPAQPSAAYDVVFASYGALCWLSDLDVWATEIGRLLRPGGRLVVMEFHPFAMVFDDKLVPVYDYFEGAVLTWDEGISDYVARSGDGLVPGGKVDGVRGFVNPHPSHEFQWSLAAVLGSVRRAGLVVDRFDEYPYANGCCFFDGSIMDEQRRFWPPPGRPRVPQMFGLRAQQPIEV